MGFQQESTLLPEGMRRRQVDILLNAHSHMLEWSIVEFCLLRDLRSNNSVG